MVDFKSDKYDKFFIWLTVSVEVVSAQKHKTSHIKNSHNGKQNIPITKQPHKTVILE